MISLLRPCYLAQAIKSQMVFNIYIYIIALIRLLVQRSSSGQTARRATDVKPCKITNLLPLIRIDEGFILDINGVDHMICAHTMAYTGDMKQQMQTAGLAHR